MEREHRTVSPLAEQRASKFSDRVRSCDPAGRLQIEFSEGLKPAVQRFRHKAHADLFRLMQGASRGRIFSALSERFLVIAEASASGGRFLCTVAEDQFSRFAVQPDDVRLPAGFLHPLQDLNGIRALHQTGSDIFPAQIRMPRRIFQETFFQQFDHMLFLPEIVFVCIQDAAGYFCSDSSF